MTDIETCFGNIIGTKKETDSDSGLYITDLEALSTIGGLVGEDFDEVDTVMDDAKRIAILSFNADLTARILKFAKPKRTYRGRIGSTSTSVSRSAPSDKGVKLVCAPIRKAQMNIFSIGVLAKQSGEVTVYVEGNDVSEEYNINAVAKKLVTKDINLTLDLQDDMARNVEYKIYHKQEEYMHNKIKCSSCSRFYYDTDRPRYSYGGYVMPGGFIGDKEGLNSMHGIVLGVEFACRADNLICDGGLNYQTNPLAHYYAQAIQHKAGSVVLWNIMRNSNLNRVLMQDIETFREAARYYERKYRDMVRDIAKTIPIDGCFCEKGFTDTWIGNRK